MACSSLNHDNDEGYKGQPKCSSLVPLLSRRMTGRLLGWLTNPAADPFA
jgi:hypothetical protein